MKKILWQISQSSEVKREEKLAALSLASNCYKFIKELATDGVVITDAVKYFNGKMDQLNNQEKKLQDIIKRQNQKEDIEPEAEAVEDVNEGLDIEAEQQTHNTVF